MKAELSLELVFAKWILSMAKYCSTSAWTLELNRPNRLLPGNLLLSFFAPVWISLQKSKILRFKFKNIRVFFIAIILLLDHRVFRKVFFFFYFLVSTWFPLPELAGQFTLIPLKKHSTKLCILASSLPGISLAEHLHSLQYTEKRTYIEYTE